MPRSPQPRGLTCRGRRICWPCSGRVSSVCRSSSGLVAVTVWGAGHTLTPGHGKTIVAAYLIGSRSTPWHTLYLGLTLTLTQSLGVFALGVISLFASQYVLPEH